MESPDNQLKKLKRENLVLRICAFVSIIALLLMLRMWSLILLIIFLYNFIVK